MTEVVVHHHSPSPSSHQHHHHPYSSSPSTFNSPTGADGDRDLEVVEEGGAQVSLLEVLVAALRKSVVRCSVSDGGGQEGFGMEIGLPTDVRHVAHVTFDRFDGFLGLPVEFEPEVPRRAPSASTTVFGVSTDSMQLSYDPRGNGVPTILLLLQRHLYDQGGLQAEGIFRITADTGQEEHVRDQLNRGVVPEGVDMHCLAGLIKAWFRELPTGILDSLSQEQVMQSESEEDCVQLARLLPPMEAALLDWAINLMADVVQNEPFNKMNARNIAVVFAPNMTKMDDPLTALMYAVQVMNFLWTLIMRTLRGRGDSVNVSLPPSSSLDPSDDIEPQSTSFRLLPQEARDEAGNEEPRVIQKYPSDEVSGEVTPEAAESPNPHIHKKNEPSSGLGARSCPWEAASQVIATKEACGRGDIVTGRQNSRLSRQSSKASAKRVAASSAEKGKGGSTILSRMSARAEVVEAWR
ncbi:hypothetical protein MLD38_035527 [Melastoma candidum]|uniref:Uncharacterized protein n=1 Tax=Melastoma candidum TaxID=119954 RepID=A0ACB9LI26_9MYRT|nr:hypothetical protein MLD38_035527 [Melastoma candidum]